MSDANSFLYILRCSILNYILRIDIKKYILVSNDKSNYDFYAFGKDACGSNFVLLDDKYIGFIDSGGQCGIIANNVKDFINILAVCRGFQNYFKKGVFDSIENFKNRFKQIVDDYDETLIGYGEYPYVVLINAMENFIKENNFETDVSVLYDRFKSALIAEPSFIIECSDSNSKWYWDDFFVFKNIEEECVSVIYKRKDESIGIINVK